MALEQIPGDLDIKLAKGDDLILQWNIPFNIAGYTWDMHVHLTNEGPVSIPVVATASTSVLGILHTTFYASTTSVFADTSNGDKHSWILKYVDDEGLTRSFIAGLLEVV